MRTLLNVLFLSLILADWSYADDVLTMEQFLKEANLQSLDIAVESANISLSEARAKGVRLEPPMVGFMQMKSSMGNANGIEASQNIPFPTKIIKDKKIRVLERDAQKQNSAYQKIVILADARAAYFAFWSAYEKVQILKAKKDWLNHHVKISKGAARSDSSAQVHYLEMESEADLIENELLTLEAELIEKKSALKIYVPSLEVDLIIPEEPVMIDLEIQKKNSSLIAWKESELASKEAYESLKKQSYIPDISIRFRSFDNSAQMPFLGQELMVGISVPFIYFWQPNAEIAEAAAQKQKASVELKKAKIEVESKTLSLSSRAQSYRAQLTVLKEKLLPRAERRARLVKNLSARTMSGLDEHNSVMLSYLDLKLKAVELRENYENTFTDLLKINGNQNSVGL